MCNWGEKQDNKGESEKYSGSLGFTLESQNIAQVEGKQKTGMKMRGSKR